MISTEEFTSNVEAVLKSRYDANDKRREDERILRAHCALAGYDFRYPSVLPNQADIIMPTGEIVTDTIDNLARMLTDAYPKQ